MRRLAWCAVVVLAGCHKDVAPPPVAPAVAIDARVEIVVVADAAPDAAPTSERPAVITDNILADADAANKRLLETVTALETAPSCTKALAAYRTVIRKHRKLERAFSAEAMALDEAAQRWLRRYLDKDPVHHRLTMAIVKCSDDKAFGDGIHQVADEEDTRD